MEELLTLLVLAVIAYYFMATLLSNPSVSKLTGNLFSSYSHDTSQIIVPEDSVLRRHFLTQLSIENASLAAEIQKKLLR